MWRAGSVNLKEKYERYRKDLVGKWLRKAIVSRGLTEGYC
jgi:hypothetical protein